MRVLLVNPDAFHVEQKATIPLGLLSIATYLAEFGHQVQIYDRIVESGSIKKLLNHFSPDIVGISAIGIKSFKDAIKVSKYSKEKNIPVVWGGQMVTLLPDIALKTGVVDFVVMGEGEITMLALIDAITHKTPLNEVDGLAYTEDGNITVNKQREFADLSELPVIDWSFVNPEKYFIKNANSDRTLHVYSSKGCPGRCTYCYSPYYSACKWRPRPAEYFIKEIKFLVDTYAIEGVFFADDLLIPNKSYLEAFCSKIIESRINFVWGCDLRVDVWSREDLQLLYDAGCRWIFFGIESGSQQRQKSVRKLTNLKRAKENIAFCKEIGIFTTTSFIIGFPDETVDELKETVDYINSLKSDVKLAFFYYPTPHSEMCNDLIKYSRFNPPATYKEWLKYPKLNQLGKNFSQVPDRELKVISAWLFWSTIFGKYRSYKRESRVYAGKAVSQTLEIFRRGSLRSTLKTLMAALEFLKISFYTVFFPRIREKYGLYKH